MNKHSFLFVAGRTRWGRLKKRFLQVIEHQAVEFKEKPARVARGCALGLGVNFFPTLGIGFLVAFALATIFRGNQVGAAAVSLLTGPLIPFKYALNFLVGGLIHAHGEGIDNLWTFIAYQYSLILYPGNFQAQLFNFLDFIGTAFILGAVINAAVFGTLFYFAVIIFLKKRLHGTKP